MNFIFNITLKSATCLALFVFCISPFFSGCYRSDNREIIVKVPSLTSIECARHLENELGKKNEAIVEIQADPEKSQVTVKYRGLIMARRNVEHYIAQLGFTVEGAPLRKDSDKPYIIKGKEDARKNLPESCR